MVMVTIIASLYQQKKKNNNNESKFEYCDVMSIMSCLSSSSYIKE